MSLAKNHRITAWIAGIGELGLWATRSEITKDSEELKWFVAGGEKAIALVATSQPENMVISRLYRLPETHPLISELLNSHGRDFEIRDQPLDDDENPYGRRFVLTGRVKRVTISEHDANSRTDPRLITLEQSTERIRTG